jgi:hypothetical protein
MKKNFSKMLGMLGLLLLAGSAFSQQALPQLGKSPVAEVVKAMTLQEKVDLVIGQGMFLPGMGFPGMGGGTEPTPAQKRVLGAAGTTVAIPRLGIPAIVLCDGPAEHMLLMVVRVVFIMQLLGQLELYWHQAGIQRFYAKWAILMVKKQKTLV